MIALTSNYTDFKLIFSAMTLPKVAFNVGPPFKAWALDNSLMLVLSTPTQPGTWSTDFATAASLNSTLSTPIG